MNFTVLAACGTNTGRIRSNNEDNFFFDGRYMPEDHGATDRVLTASFPAGEGRMLAVFDGMGGENYGELASYTAAEAIAHTGLQPKDFQRITDYAEEQAQELNLAVVEQQRIMKTSHMGTTMAAIYFTAESAVVSNLGDSRVYRLRDGRLWQLSEDHVSSRPMSSGRKAPLTQNLGVDPEELLLEPSVSECRLRAGDCFLLCSDGVTDMLEDGKICELLSQGRSPAETVEALIASALEAGGRDNITAIVCSVEGDAEETVMIPVRKSIEKTDSDNADKTLAVSKRPTERKRSGLIALLPVLLLVLLAAGYFFHPKNTAATIPTPVPADSASAITPAPTPHSHSWSPANCVRPATCTICGEKQGSALGHSWEVATCTSPETCTVCGETRGNALGHSWEEEICTVCGAKKDNAFDQSGTKSTDDCPQIGTESGVPNGCEGRPTPTPTDLPTDSGNSSVDICTEDISYSKRYAVSVAYSQSLNSCETNVKRLREKGYNAFLYVENNKTDYWVLIGVFGTKQEAEDFAESLRAQPKVKGIRLKDADIKEIRLSDTEANSYRSPWD